MKMTRLISLLKRVDHSPGPIVQLWEDDSFDFVGVTNELLWSLISSLSSKKTDFLK